MDYLTYLLLNRNLSMGHSTNSFITTSEDNNFLPLITTQMGKFPVHHQATPKVLDLEVYGRMYLAYKVTPASNPPLNQLSLHKKHSFRFDSHN